MRRSRSTDGRAVRPCCAPGAIADRGRRTWDRRRKNLPCGFRPQVSLNQYRGQVVLVNFWATWCPPCVEELPSLMTLQERMKARGVVVVGVSIDVDGDAYHRS